MVYVCVWRVFCEKELGSKMFAVGRGIIGQVYGFCGCSRDLLRTEGDGVTSENVSGST